MDVSVGQRVRIMLEGEVRNVQGDKFLVVVLGLTGDVIWSSSEHVVSVEVLSDPEPDVYKAVITRDGNVWVRYPTSAGDKERWARIGGPSDWSTWEDLDDPRPAVRAERRSTA